MKTFVQAINEAIQYCMEKDSKTLFFGLGATDPKRIFGSSLHLSEKFGNDRVFDMPTSENGMTGIAIGAAINGYRPVMCHQRLDFFLLAMDQVINNAAKWHYMFGGQDSVPLTVRLILGRGWGQGPTHSQNLQSWFAHIPGLKVVMPSTVQDAKGLLISSIMDNNPVIFLEHRWLYNQVGEVPEITEPIPLGKARVLSEGSELTVVSMSYMTIEAIRAIKLLSSQGFSIEHIDLRTISPLDWNTIEKSVRKTGRLLVLDTAQEDFSVSSEIISHVSISNFSDLKQAPQKIGSPNCPVPTSFGLTNIFYPTAYEVAQKICFMLDKKASIEELNNQEVPHDVPGDWFKGPF